jgi:hypothetical protein
VLLSHTLFNAHHIAPSANQKKLLHALPVLDAASIHNASPSSTADNLCTRALTVSNPGDAPVRVTIRPVNAVLAPADNDNADNVDTESASASASPQVRPIVPSLPCTVAWPAAFTLAPGAALPVLVHTWAGAACALYTHTLVVHVAATAQTGARAKAGAAPATRPSTAANVSEDASEALEQLVYAPPALFGSAFPKNPCVLPGKIVPTEMDEQDVRNLAVQAAQGNMCVRVTGEVMFL